MRSLLPVAALAAALACAHVALRTSGLGLPRLSDEGEYAYAARVWAEGGLPYRDAALQKPPMAVGLYRLAQLAGGSPVAPRALALLFSLATMALLAAAAPPRWGTSARAAPAAAYAALSTLPVGDYAFPANTEVFLCGFLALAAWSLRRGWDAPKLTAPRWAALCGLACGAAVMTKQTAIFPLLALGLLCAWTGPGRYEARRALLFFAGAAAIPALWLAYFQTRGGLPWLLEYAWSRNGSYVSVGGLDAVAEQGRWLATWLGPMLLKGFWPALALAVYGLRGEPAGWSRRCAALGVLWLGAAAASTLTGLLLFPHYFLQLAPPLSLLAALGVRKLSERSAKAAWAAVVALIAVPALSYAPLYSEGDRAVLSRKLLWPNPLVGAQTIGERLSQAADRGDSVYVFGSEPQIYAYANRRCPTRNIFAYLLTTLKPLPGEVDEEMASLRAAKPAFVVYSRQPLSTLIAHSEGVRFRDEMRLWLLKEYLYAGEVGPGQTREDLKAQRPSKVDFSPADSLMIFERRDRKGRFFR